MPFCLKSFTHHFLMSELETPIVLLLTIPGSLGLRKGRVGPQGIWLNVGDGSGSASRCGPSLSGFCRLRHIYVCVRIHTHTHTLYIYIVRIQWNTAATAAKLPQSCPTLCDPIDSSPPGSPVPGILQARTLEWVAISFSNV